MSRARHQEPHLHLLHKVCQVAGKEEKRKIRPAGAFSGGPFVLWIVLAVYWAFTVQSSMTNEVARDEFSVPVK